MGGKSGLGTELEWGRRETTPTTETTLFSSMKSMGTLFPSLFPKSVVSEEGVSRIARAAYLHNP
jgi:hypothetical protein